MRATPTSPARPSTAPRGDSAAGSPPRRRLPPPVVRTPRRRRLGPDSEALGHHGRVDYTDEPSRGTTTDYARRRLRHQRRQSTPPTPSALIAMPLRSVTSGPPSLVRSSTAR